MGAWGGGCGAIWGGVIGSVPGVGPGDVARGALIWEISFGDIARLRAAAA